MTYSIKMPANGRIVLPAELRKRLGLEGGGALMIIENDRGQLEIKSRDQMIRELQEEYRRVVGPDGGTSVDEFIAERRREAELEP